MWHPDQNAMPQGFVRFDTWPGKYQSKVVKIFCVPSLTSKFSVYTLSLKSLRGNCKMWENYPNKQEWDCSNQRLKSKERINGDGMGKTRILAGLAGVCIITNASHPGAWNREDAKEETHEMQRKNKGVWGHEWGKGRPGVWNIPERIKFRNVKPENKVEIFMKFSPFIPEGSFAFSYFALLSFRLVPSFFLSLLGHVAQLVGALVPRPGTEPTSLQWECRVLPTRTLGNSLRAVSFLIMKREWIIFLGEWNSSCKIIHLLPSQLLVSKNVFKNYIIRTFPCVKLLKESLWLNQGLCFWQR